MLLFKKVCSQPRFSERANESEGPIRKKLYVNLTWGQNNLSICYMLQIGCYMMLLLLHLVLSSSRVATMLHRSSSYQLIKPRLPHLRYLPHVAPWVFLHGNDCEWQGMFSNFSVMVSEKEPFIKCWMSSMTKQDSKLLHCASRSCNLWANSEQCVHCSLLR